MTESFDFDKKLDRRNTDSLKWDRYKRRNVIPMWVADMDFRSPGPILEALHKRVDHGIFGYTVPPDELVQVIITRILEKYQWKIEPSWIVWLPGVVPALHLACLAFADDGDDVLTFTPVYPPFLSAPSLSGRRLKSLPLRHQANRYTMDAESLENEISPRSKVLLLCNPHNPVGRRYGRRELSDIAEVCVAHNIVICSDEIHCDLILDGQEHIPTATLSPEISAHTITLMAPSKTFNTPGLNCAFAIIENKDLRTRFRQARKGIVPNVNALGFAASLAAYRDCEPWRTALIDYLTGNKDIVYKTVNEEIPGLSMDDVQATYLAWIDVTKLGLSDPVRFFESAGVGLSDGRDYAGEGYVRLNFGCPRKTLMEALERMRSAVTARG
jgi:cystathionine beta-lyase